MFLLLSDVTQVVLQLLQVVDRGVVHAPRRHQVVLVQTQVLTARSILFAQLRLGHFLSSDDVEALSQQGLLQNVRAVHAAERLVPIPSLGRPCALFEKLEFGESEVFEFLEVVEVLRITGVVGHRIK